ncbi:hypothetical protein HYV30_04500 [Candidatus Kaiserbacteria bacterium]|nr:hypothetical protein [Candidatus Kaiserbacteria bacterium]
MYQDPNFVTLYRYENPSVSYDEGREGIISKQALICGWFTDNLNDLRTYIKMRHPGGRIVVIRVPRDRLETYDARKNEETKEMDTEPGNFVVPQEEQAATRIEIPFPVESSAPKKFLMSDFGRIDAFIEQELTSERLIEKAGSQQRSPL